MGKASRSYYVNPGYLPVILEIPICAAKDFARTLWLLPLGTLRRETLSESVSRRPARWRGTAARQCKVGDDGVGRELLVGVGVGVGHGCSQLAVEPSATYYARVGATRSYAPAYARTTSAGGIDRASVPASFIEKTPTRPECMKQTGQRERSCMKSARRYDGILILCMWTLAQKRRAVRTEGDLFRQRVV